ncbi:MAG: class I SAM-dependent methyltransferase [Eubacterium sp.]|nr:class I SAM-dependent methyltransferase [Eubacterium sp.]
MYESLSALYDFYMDEVPYEKWFENIKYFLEKYGVKGKQILDLGCGTGTMSILLKKGGFDVTGIDISEDMLTVAAEKAEEENVDIFFS